MSIFKLFQGRKSSNDEWDDNDFEQEEYDINDIPEGCRACGGEYPHCTSSCPLFDD